MAVSVLDAAVLQHCGLVELDAVAVDMASSGDLVGMEVIEARSPLDVVRGVAQDVRDRGGGEQNIGMGRQV